MKIITLVALLTVTLIAASGMLPEGSVGGPMMLALVFLGAALVVGLYEAWSMKRGPLGWIASIVAALFGGILGASLGTVVLEGILMLVQPEGSLMATNHPLLYIGLNAEMLCTLLGSWAVLKVVDRLR